MKKLIILGSVCALMNFDILAMESFGSDGSKPFSEQSVDYRKAWTESHTILLNHIKNAGKSEADYEKALNIVKKAYLNVDACDAYGDMLLFVAAELKDPRILIALLDKNPKNINAKNDWGCTAFYWFISKCYKESYSDFKQRKQAEQKETTRSLPILRSGVDTSASRSFAEYDREKKVVGEIFSYFDEHLSYESSVSSVVEKFIKHKADISGKDLFNKMTPLHYAVEYNDTDTVRLMLNYDSSFINDLTDFNLSALDYAIRNKNISIIELLVEKGAKVDFKNLKCALEEPELLKILLPNKDSLSKIENGEAILSHCSVFNINEDIVDFLVDRGASVDTPDKFGHSFISDFIYYYKGNNKKLIDKVIESSKNLGSFDNTDWRFNHINPLISEKLAQAKADLESKN